MLPCSLTNSLAPSILCASSFGCSRRSLSALHLIAPPIVSSMIASYCCISLRVDTPPTSLRDSLLVSFFQISLLPCRLRDPLLGCSPRVALVTQVTRLLLDILVHHDIRRFCFLFQVHRLHIHEALEVQQQLPVLFQCLLTLDLLAFTCLLEILWTGRGLNSGRHLAVVGCLALDGSIRWPWFHLYAFFFHFINLFLRGGF
mmetsp:Transcript_28632/g.92365  ORF Transcript_28632/g.92365 Transcript_28632/m.92365 type:complete len:201 (+) Transcript_28632:126-728(+)